MPSLSLKVKNLGMHCWVDFKCATLYYGMAERERRGASFIWLFGSLPLLPFPFGLFSSLGLPPSKSSESHHDRVRQYRAGRGEGRAEGRKEGRKEGWGICRTSAKDPRLFARHRHEDVSMGYWGAAYVAPRGRGCVHCGQHSLACVVGVVRQLVGRGRKYKIVTYLHIQNVQYYVPWVISSLGESESSWSEACQRSPAVLCCGG